MKLDDLIESAIWITGDESQLTRKRYEQDVIQAIDDLCSEEGFERGPVSFIEKLPGSDRVPEVPDHVHGSRVRLLVCEALIIGKSVLTSAGSFVDNLDRKDLMRLRIITRTAWIKRNPGQVLTDGECDHYIEQLGPETAIATLRSHTLQ